MPDEPLPALEYDRSPPGYVSRRRHRLLVTIPWVILAGLLLFAVLPMLLATLRGWQQRRQATATVVMTTPAPVAMPAAVTVVAPPPPPPDLFAHFRTWAHDAGVVTYEEDPVAAARLFAQSDPRYTRPSMQETIAPYGSAFQPPAMLPMPVPADLEYFLRPPADSVTVAAVDRTSAGGNRRMVLLNLRATVRGRRANEKSPYLIRLERQLSYRVLATDAGGTNPRLMREGVSLRILTPEGDEFPIDWKDGVLKADRPASAHVRLLTAVADPADPSHFSLPFAAGTAVKGQLDVWLGDDDFLRVKPSAGAVTGGDWYLTGKPPAATAAPAGR